MPVTTMPPLFSRRMAARSDSGVIGVTS